MMMPVRASHVFLDGPGAELFVRELSAAVAPVGRRSLAATLPLFILRVQGKGPSQTAAAHDVAQDILSAFATVPHACLSVRSDDDGLLSLRAVEILQATSRPHVAPDRYPRSTLMADAVTCGREQPGGPPGTGVRHLRDQVFHQQQLRRGSAFGTLISSLETSGRFAVIGLRLVHLAHRAWWSWRTSRKVMRWLGDLPVAADGGSFFEVMDRITAAQAASPGSPASPASPASNAEEVLQEQECLVLRALFEDLRMPRLRRRIARPVLLLELPPAGAEGARAAERFLIAVHRVASTFRERAEPSIIGGPLVIAVGRPSEGLLRRLDNPPECDVRQAGRALRDNGGAPVLVGLQERELHSPAFEGARAAPVRFRLSRRARSRMQAALVARGKSRMSMPFGSRESAGQSEGPGRRQWHARVAVGLWILLLSASAWLGLRDVLDSFRIHGRLGPSDAPALVTTIVALGTATGTLIGVTLTAYAKYVQARGQAESDLIRAKAELMRAEADMVRARAQLPAVEATTNGDGPASPSPGDPDAD
ncbi:hypothetical protein ACFW91_12085 [Streptomyces asoensis]|uniref:hypothetical protein n=1 Tax=Streptomyces asoensis TaxID=249586 RepID=UPI003684F5BA